MEELEEEAEELQEEEYEEDEGDYDEEEEVTARSNTKKSAPSRHGSNLVDFFAASLSASASRLNTPSRQKSTPSSASKLAKTTKSSMQSPSHGRSSSSITNRSQSTSKRLKPTHQDEYDEYDDYDNDEGAEDAYVAGPQPRKRAALNSAPPPAQPYWQHPMASYDPYYGSNWHHDLYSYWNSAPPQQHYCQHPYYQYQQPQAPTTADETKAYYYGLAMGLYQAANLIYEKRVAGAHTQPTSHPEEEYFYNEENGDSELEEPEPTRKRRPKSKSSLSANTHTKPRPSSRK